MLDLFELIYTEEVIKSQEDNFRLILEHQTGAYFMHYKNQGLMIFNDNKGNKLIYVKNNLSYTDENDVTHDIPKGKSIRSDGGKIILNSASKEVVLEQAYHYFKTKQKYPDFMLEDIHLN